jgi:hypothetical protein
MGTRCIKIDKKREQVAGQYLGAIVFPAHPLAVVPDDLGPFKDPPSASH